METLEKKYWRQRSEDLNFIFVYLDEAIKATHKATANYPNGIFSIEPGYIVTAFYHQVLKTIKYELRLVGEKYQSKKDREKKEAELGEEYERKENKKAVAIDDPDVHINIIDKSATKSKEYGELISSEKTGMFFNYIIKKAKLTKGNKTFLNLMITVAERDCDEGIQRNENETWDELFWNKVEDEAREQDINDDRYRQMKSRFFERVKPILPESKGTLMNFIDLKEQQALQTLLDCINPILSEKHLDISLKAYRFSSKELNKMQSLKEMFENNGFSFETDRFPEVYYDDYEVVIEKYPQLASKRKEEEEYTADDLGVYINELSENILDDKGEVTPFAKTKEGIIVLFKDRIESYAKGNTTEVCQVVLIHQLAHWMMHWAKYQDRRWDTISYLPMEKTQETFANLITCWAFGGHWILNDLSPKNENGEIDATKNHGAYILLAEKSIEIILDKLKEARKYWMILDEKMFEFLLSDMNTVEGWIKTLTLTDPNLPWKDLVSDEIASSLSNSFYIRNKAGQFNKVTLAELSLIDSKVGETFRKMESLGLLDNDWID